MLSPLKVVTQLLSEIAPIYGVDENLVVDFREEATPEQRALALAKIDEWRGLTPAQRETLIADKSRDRILESLPQALRAPAVNIFQKVKAGTNLTNAESQDALRIILRLLYHEIL